MNHEFILTHYQAGLINQNKLDIDLQQYKQLFKRGILLDPRLYNQDTFPMELVETHYGMNPLKLNSTFYKSFKDLANRHPLMIQLERFLHYNGKYNQNALPYIPSDLDRDLDRFYEEVAGEPFVYIKALTKDQLIEQVEAELYANIAMNLSDINNLIPLVLDLGIQPDYDRVKNRDLLARLSLKTKTLPQDPTQALRVLLAVVSPELSLIKSKENIDLLEMNLVYSLSYRNRVELVKLFDQLPLESYATIFYRYKPLFLKFKAIPALKPRINKIRRLAKTHHKPHQQPVLTNLIQGNYKPSVIEKALQNAGLPAIVRAYNAVNYQLLYQSLQNDQPQDGVYYIRNGKTYVRPNLPPRKCSKDYLRRVKDQLFKAICERLEETFQGRPIKQSKNLDLALPTSTRSFVAGLPRYTTLHIEDAQSLVVGISWDKKCDIDLSAYCVDDQGQSNLIDWRSNDYANIYSGDMVHLNQHGFAAEAMRIKPDWDMLFQYVLYSANDDNLTATSFIAVQDALLDYDRTESITAIGDLLVTGKHQVQHGVDTIGFYDHQQKTFSFGEFRSFNGTRVTNNWASSIVMDQLRLRSQSALKLSDVLPHLTQDTSKSPIDLRWESLNQAILLNYLT